MRKPRWKLPFTRFSVLIMLVVTPFCPRASAQTVAPATPQTPPPSAPSDAADTDNTAPSIGAIVLSISARVVDSDRTALWQANERQITIPGQSVGLKLVGGNLAVLARFTPYHHTSNTLYIVAQAQIWLEIPGQGIQYYTTLQTIPIEYGEELYFFPLGNEDGAPQKLEILVAAAPEPANEN
jgi:hypothetical protein